MNNENLLHGLLSCKVTLNLHVNSIGLTVVVEVYTFQLQTFHPYETVNKKKSGKCKKQGIKNFFFLYYIQGKCGDIADKNPNVADDDE